MTSELLARATNQFAVVMDTLSQAAQLTDNAEADKVLDRANAALKQITREDVEALVTTLNSVLQSHRVEAENLRQKSCQPGLAPALAPKFAKLAKDWQGVIASLDLKVDEVKAIKNDLGKSLESFDQERDYWRARIRSSKTASSMKRQMHWACSWFVARRRIFPSRSTPAVSSCPNLPMFYLLLKRQRGIRCAHHPNSNGTKDSKPSQMTGSELVGTLL